mgnify:CR=1 FL=1
MEETGYRIPNIKQYVLENILPLEETFMGSNYKNYKHKYYYCIISRDFVKFHFKNAFLAIFFLFVIVGAEMYIVMLDGRRGFRGRRIRQ